MRSRLLLLFSLLVLSAVLTTTPGRLAAEKSVFEVTQLSEGIFELSTDGGGYIVKVIASVGSDGILLVDAGQKDTGQDLLAVLQTLADKGPSDTAVSHAGESSGSASARSGAVLPKIIINTHSHIEHTGGNMAFGRGPLIIGHDNLRKRLRSDSFLFDEFPDEAIPQLTFGQSMSLHFNGEDIRLIAFTGAHDNSDILVWFTKSKIVCVGALCNGLHFPSVDGATGDVMKYPDVVAQVIQTLPDDVSIIPGHGEDCTMKDFRTFHAMLVETMDIVRAGLADGKDAAALKEEDVLKDWAAFECSYVDRAQWIDYLAQGILGKPEADRGKKKLFEPMYHAIKEKGADEAIRQYYEMKADRSDAFVFNEATPVSIALKLFENGKPEASLKFFELTLSEYPEGKYAPWCYYYIALIHENAGARELAIQNYKKSLELNPDNSDAKERLQELEQ